MKNEQIFAVVLAFAVFAVIYILNVVPTAMVAAPISSHNTVMIQKIDLNEYIGNDYPAVSSSSLPGLGEGTIRTSRGSTDYGSVLKLKGALVVSYEV